MKKILAIGLALLSSAVLAARPSPAKVEGETSSEGGRQMAFDTVWAVQIGVTDMGRAIEFFQDAFGFTIAVGGPESFATSLEHEGTILLLHRATQAADIDYPREAQMTMTLEVENLDATVLLLREAGATILHDEPQVAPVGKWIAFRDPFGNVHHAMQPTKPSEGKRPSLYVLGVKTNDIDKALAFYAGTLGMTVFTKDYYPIVPLDTKRAMLVLHQTAEVATAPSGYPDVVQTLAILEVDDVDASMEALRQRGVTFLQNEPIATPVGRYVGFVDPFGNVLELLEPIPSEIDPRTRETKAEAAR